ncbi:MAG: T9SS type A sorting domain-containing protein [Ignavibacterium sp.]
MVIIRNILLTVSISALNIAFAQWQSLNGPSGGNVTAVGKSGSTLLCAVSDETIYSNNKIDFFSSTDNGNNWSVKSQLTGTGVYQINSTNTAIFVQSRTGSFEYFLYRSTNSGNSWELIFDSLFIMRIRTDGDKIYVPTSQGLQYSSDNGENWNNISSNLPLPNNVLCTENFNGTLYAGLADSGVYKSANNGISWMRSWANGLTRTIRYIFNFNNTLFASEGEVGTNRIYKSTDNGLSWIQTTFFPLSLNYYYINDIKVSGNGIFMSVAFRQCSSCLLEGGVLYSSDGNSWELRRQGILPNLVNAIELNGSDIFIGSGSGVFKSNNNGTQWSKSSDGIVKSQITHLTFSSGAEWAVGLRGAGALVSADSGFSWVERNNGLDNLPNPTIISSIVKGNKWFIGTESNGIYTSTNQGNEWISAGLVGELPITAFAIKGGTDIIVTRNVTDGVYRSTDDGNTWQQIMSGFTSPSGVLSVAIGGSGNIFVGNANGYVLRSTNNGTNWTGSEVASGNGVRFLRQVGLKWFAATTNGIYRSTDFGVSWSPTGLQGSNVNFIAIKNSADTSTLFTSTNDAGVFFSTDNGSNWFPSNAGLLTLNITGIRSTGTYLYAGTNGEGLWRIKINDLITDVEEEINSTIPSDFHLNQNYPNPFNPSTKISWQSPVGGWQTLKVYDVLGNEVATLVNEERPAGSYEIEFDATNLSSGIYFYRLSVVPTARRDLVLEDGQANSFIETKKMILLK